MDELLRMLVEAKGGAVDPDADLHVELGGFPSGGSGLLVILGVIAAVAIVIYAYRRDAHRLTRGRRNLLMVLRALAVLVACGVLLDPRVVAVRHEVQPGHTILLLDGSQSMAQHDSYRQPAVAELAAAWRAIGIEDPATVTRSELMRRLLERDDHAVLERLRADNNLLVYAFGAELRPMGEFHTRPPTAEAGAEPVAEPLVLAEIPVDGAYTDIGGAIRAALGRSSTAAVAGIVVLTDGRRNLGAQGPEVARLLRNRGVPATVVLPIGDPSPVRTLRIARLDAPEKVFQKDPFKIEARIEGDGYDSAEFDVHLKRRSADGSEVSVRTERVRIGGARPTVGVTFDDLRTSEPGTATWSVEIDPPDFEALSPERHVRRTQIEVLGERTRVLLIAGGPSHEYRILRNLLQRDATIEVACWLSSADAAFPQDGNVSLQSLPTTPEELETWDVFVLMDPDSRRLSSEFCQQIADQVDENGAGLWWICGEKFSREALQEGASTEPLADLLPVHPDLDEAAASIGLARGMPRSWDYQLTVTGGGHAVARISDDRSDLAGLWRRLPGFYFAFPVLDAKPGAMVLVEHVRPSAGEPGPYPLIATQFVGAGRVLFTATDDTYRWRIAFEKNYDQFWVKGVRYLYEGRLNAGNSRLRLTVDTERADLGQVVKVTVEARTESFEPLIAPDFDVRLIDENDDAELVGLRPVEGVPGQYEAYVRPTHTGWFRIEPRNPPPGRSVQAAFQIVPAALEKEGPVDLAELQAVAAAPGAVLVADPSGFAAALDAIRSQTRIEAFANSQPLWDTWWTIALLTTLLAIEWWLRKRSNLL